MWQDIAMQEATVHDTQFDWSHHFHDFPSLTDVYEVEWTALNYCFFIVVKIRLIKPEASRLLLHVRNKMLINKNHAF